jgi:TorA maturation chaperone TorD
MTLQVQTTITTIESTQSTDTCHSGEGIHQMPSDLSHSLEQDQLYRASSYALIAALLRTPPNSEMLAYIAQLIQQPHEDSDDLLVAMSTLGLSAKMLNPASIDDEYHDLFIGLGKGELVPYASWYLTGFLMEKPLSDLRDDLAQLGYQRDESVTEPEDHAAALCEVMSLLITEGTALEIQKAFYSSHLASWIDRFYSDLSEAKSAVFYKSLGRFGAAFNALEGDYFSMQS